MKKVISVFQRNYETDRLIRNEVVPGAEWVLAGEGVATRKWDGSCCMLRDGSLYKRYELKRGKNAPVGFEAAQEQDPVTGDQPGWVPVRDVLEDKWFRSAWGTLSSNEIQDGTHEAVGPHFGGGSHSKNPEGLSKDNLWRHGSVVLEDAPREFNAIREYLLSYPDKRIEGIVFHHPDGRMAKVKARDYGIKRAAQTA